MRMQFFKAIHFYFTSALSPALNMGLITPDDILDRSIEFARREHTHKFFGGIRSTNFRLARIYERYLSRIW